MAATPTGMVAASRSPTTPTPASTTWSHSWATAGHSWWGDFRTPGSQHAAAQWSHGWDTAGASWWGDFGYSTLTQTQAQFVADHYYLASLEKCTGRAQGLVTEDGIYSTAAQLKALNKDVKVAFYWHTGQAGISCYWAQKEFEAHQEWWLRDDHGNVVGHKDSTHPAGQPRIDWTVEAAADWWVSVPLRGYNGTSAARAAQLIDGVLADGAGFESIPNISAARLQTLYRAKLSMLGRLQAAFDGVGRGGVVFGNGLSEYDQDPQDPHNEGILSAVRGVQNEHFAAFEQVQRDGTLNLAKVSDALDVIEWASNLGGNGSASSSGVVSAGTAATAATAGTAATTPKQVFCSFWAGPYVGFSTEEGLAKGWPRYHDNSQPCGSNSTQGLNCTAAQHYAGWRAALARWLPFNLASFLSVAQPTTWFTQAVWYEVHQGFVPCDDAPDTCALASSFYADYLKRPLGAPRGRRVKVGPYQWTREFEHATVTLDLTSPLEGTSIVFRDPTVVEAPQFS